MLTLAKGSLALIGVTLTGRKRGAGLATGALQIGSDSQVANALLFESAIENSIGVNAGGAYALNNASLRVDRSTIARNRADYGLNGDGGGGIYVAAGGELVLHYSTISDNIADGRGGRLHCSTGSIFLKATLVAGNIDGSGIAPDCAGSMQRQGFNLLETTNGCMLDGLPTSELANVAAPLSGHANLADRRARADCLPATRRSTTCRAPTVPTRSPAPKTAARASLNRPGFRGGCLV